MARTRLQGFDLAGVTMAVEVPPEWQRGRRRGDPSCDWIWPRRSPLDAEIHVGVRLGSVESPLRDAFWYRSEDATFEVGRCPGTRSRQGDWVVAVYGSRGCERIARFDDALADVDVVVDPVASPGLASPLQDPIDEVLLSHHLAASGGALVYGSLSRGDGGGAVLTVCAPSSEPPGRRHPSASRGGTSRDRVVIRLGCDDEVWVHPTGWSDSAVQRGRASGRMRLEAIRVVEVAAQPFREVMDIDSAACELLAHASAPVHHPEGAVSVAATIGRVASRVRVNRIGEPRNAQVVEFTWGARQAGLAFAPPA